MTPQLLQDKCRGSLVGGAAGDALGYAVEFLSLNTIHRRFGQGGIREYAVDAEGVARFSDDTQMTLFTAEGLLSAIAAGKVNETDLLPYIAKAYCHWYFTQSRPPMKMSGSRLSGIPELWALRAPGNTCLSALRTLSLPNPGPVINNSKGCGGVMRVAPIGIFSAAHPQLLDLLHAGLLAGQAAEITHKHPLSTYSSMALAMIVAACISREQIDRPAFSTIVISHVFSLLELHLGDDIHLFKLRALLQKALDLATSPLPDTEAIPRLGQGWVAEETLAIAIFSVMRHIADFEKCIRCAVNHDGDSDSTGAVAGNIIGALLGLSAIPEKYLTTLELHPLLLTIADDLAGLSSPLQMHQPSSPTIP